MEQSRIRDKHPGSATLICCEFVAMNYRSFGPGAEHHDPALEGVEAHRQVSVLQGLAGVQDIIYSHQ
jgi:hypothetical protein